MKPTEYFILGVNKEDPSFPGKIINNDPIV
jgi:hypothetical protein